MTEKTQPTDNELVAFATEEQFLLFCDEDDFVQIARAVLAKWGTPQVGAVPLTPFIPAQRERLYYNRPENVGKSASLADWHRIVQYIEAAHGIKGDQHE